MVRLSYVQLLRSIRLYFDQASIHRSTSAPAASTDTGSDILSVSRDETTTRRQESLVRKDAQTTILSNYVSEHVYLLWRFQSRDLVKRVVDYAWFLVTRRMMTTSLVQALYVSNPPELHRVFLLLLEHQLVGLDQSVLLVH